jgi:hypothetical protein
MVVLDVFDFDEALEDKNNVVNNLLYTLTLYILLNAALVDGN